MVAATTPQPASLPALAPVDCFDGEFAFLALAAQLRYGQLPGAAYPTSSDFALAVSAAAHDLDTYVEAHWHIEAVRQRILEPGTKLDDAALHEINVRVAKRLYDRSRS